MDRYTMMCCDHVLVVHWSWYNHESTHVRTLGRVCGCAGVCEFADLRFFLCVVWGYESQVMLTGSVKL